MAETRNAAAGASLINWPQSVVLSTPLLTVMADINGKLLESAASAQKDWADFVHRRVQEDVAASQQLMGCKSLSDMQQLYVQYMRTVFEQYREQSEKAVQRGKWTTKGLTRTLEPEAREPVLEVGH